MSSMPPTLTPPRLTSQERLLQEIRKKRPEYHPVVAIADLAHSTENEALQFMCHKEVAKYTQVIDKHVEIDEKITRTRRVVVELFGAPTPYTVDAITGERVLPALGNGDVERLGEYSLTEALATAYVDPDGEDEVVVKRTTIRTYDDQSQDGDEAPISPRLGKW